MKNSPGYTVYVPECDEYLFLTEYEYRILFGFQKSPNIEYRILLGIEKIRIPNTEYYSVSRKSKYRIRIVLFGLTIRIPNTTYRIIYKILEKIKLISRNFSHTRHFVLKICETIWTGIRSNYSNTRILFGMPKIQIPNTEYYSVLRKAEYRIRILLFGPTIRIVFEYRIIRHTLVCSLLEDH